MTKRFTLCIKFQGEMEDKEQTMPVDKNPAYIDNLFIMTNKSDEQRYRTCTIRVLVPMSNKQQTTPSPQKTTNPNPSPKKKKHNCNLTNPIVCMCIMKGKSVIFQRN